MFTKTLQRRVRIFITGLCFVILSSAVILYAEPTDQPINTDFEDVIPNTNIHTIGTSPNTATFNGNLGFRATTALYHSGLRAFWIETGGETGTVTFETPASIVEFYARDVGASGSGKIEVLDAANQAIETIPLTGSWVLYKITTLIPIKSLRLTNNGTVLSGIDDFGFTPATFALDDPLPDPIEKGTIEVELKLIAEGLVAPNYLIPAPDGTDRLFVVDQPGQIRIIEDGVLLEKPFLDVADRIVPLGFFGTFDENDFDERGILGLAFHPDYANEGTPGFGKIYTYTSEPNDQSSDFTVTMDPGEVFNHQTIITEWMVDSQDQNMIDPSSRREILRMDQPQFNHDGGMLTFGPDGYLYISLGDGGNRDDEGPGHGLTGNGQDKNTILGSIVRIDPLDPAATPGSSDPASANGKYRIPADNPFVGTDGIDEIYAYGFRNPFRFSFDSVSGDLVVGDVGQGEIEEIDIVTKGGNYGWNLKEGSFRFDPSDSSVSFDFTGLPPDLIDPVAQYDHDEGITVIGGFVYHGSRFPDLQGKYVFGDFSRDFFTPDGRLLYADLTTGEIKQLILALDDRELGLFIKGFGQDAEGELYLLAGTNLGPFGNFGQVWKISPICHPVLLGDLDGNCFVDLRDFALLAANWLQCNLVPVFACDNIN